VAALLAALALAACSGKAPTTPGSSTGSQGTSGGRGPSSAQRTVPTATPRQVRAARERAGYPLSIAFWDGERGLVGTGAEVGRYCAGTISITNDGGHTLRVLRRVQGLVEWVTTAGTADAWARVQVCRANSHGRSRLLHTDDAGRTWERLPGDRVWQPSFANASRGLAFGLGRDSWDRGPAPNAATPLKSANGGGSWQARAGRVCHGHFYGYNYAGRAVSFPDPSNAWAVCTAGPGTDVEYKVLYESTDGGHTWEKVSDGRTKSHTPKALPPVGYVQQVSFTGDGFGVLDTTDGDLYASEDGGRRWRELSRHALPPAPGRKKSRFPDLGPAVAVAPRTILALVFSGSAHYPRLLARSDDGGTTWVLVHTWLNPNGS
jgi:photosystem II stability/assembly factor-like uncharacterized protein